MLIRRVNKYCTEPTPYQAQAMGQWVGACRHEYNHVLERRQYEYRGVLPEAVNLIRVEAVGVEALASARGACHRTIVDDEAGAGVAILPAASAWETQRK